MLFKCNLNSSNNHFSWFLRFLILLAASTLTATTTLLVPSVNNQVIKLIIKSYVNDILEDPFLKEHELKHKISKINDHIATHPALHQQYLWVGSSPPPDDYNPDLHILEYEHQPHYNNITGLVTKQSMLKVKRKKNSEKREQLPSEEICETKEKWEQIIETHDLFDNKVKVIQEKDMLQFVFTYRCAKNKGKCLGISPLFESECTERFGWMYMYYRQEDKPPQWGFVNAPHHCACKLKPKLFQEK